MLDRDDQANDASMPMNSLVEQCRGIPPQSSDLQATPLTGVTSPRRPQSAPSFSHYQVDIHISRQVGRDSRDFRPPLYRHIEGLPSVGVGETVDSKQRAALASINRWLGAREGPSESVLYWSSGS